MFRWIQGTFWVTGSCILSCPLCVCISGGGSWWVCACTIGLISITMVSGYVTWTVFSQLLNESSSDRNFLARYLTLRTKDNNENKEKEVSSGIDSSFLEREISITAQAFHSHLVLPWYSHISPDDKYSLQIRSTLEDLLTGVFKNLRQHINLSVLFQEILILYMQHYRQFYRALRKVSQKSKKRPFDCITHEKEIIEAYKPIHAALKSKNGVHLHCRRLVHLLLINYLPSEVTRCGLLFVCVRDLFAQNLLHAVLDLFCDGHWLNEALADALSQTTECTSKEEPPSDCEEGSRAPPLDHENEAHDPSLREDRVYSYTHSLSAIREETSFEVMDMDCASNEARCLHAPHSPQRRGEGLRKESFLLPPPRVTSGGRNKAKKGLGSLVPPPPAWEAGSMGGRWGNSHGLLEYVQSSNLEKDSSEAPRRSVATALGDLISTTAVPLLPDAAAFPPLPTKMWKSPLEEDRGVIPPEMKPLFRKNPFKRAIVEGITETDYKELRWKLKEDEEEEEQQSGPLNEVKVESCNSCGSSFKDVLLPSSAESSRRASRESQDHFLKPTEIHRSKSLNSLPSSKTDEELEAGVLSASSKLSFSSETIPRAWFSLDETDDEARGSRGGKASWRKAKGHLQKMKSFDRNDGTDEFSLTCGVHTSSKKDVGDSDPSKLSATQRKLLPPSAFEKKEPLHTVSVSPPSTSSSTSTLAGGVDPVEKLNPDCLDLEISPLEEGTGTSFGWENPPDLSPIYEESENLASTIAKLRCLLSERQSQHSLGSQSSFGSSESEPKSAQSDPGRYSLEKARFTFLHKDSSGSLASVKSTSSTDSAHCCLTGPEEELLEASEVPIDGKVFVNVSIPTTEVHSEAAGFHYTMYLIQYDAIYFYEVLTLTPSEGTAASDGVPSGGHKMMLQTNVVKRRFREFLSLHSALEDDPALRAAMKGIKGPNKWLNLPFSKLDSATISSRKQFLEKYLQALVQRPLINTCAALKDFLAYGCDSSLAFGKKPLEINVPRLDKLLARTVSGVFHSIKTALPNFDSAETPVQGHVVSGIAAFQIAPGGRGGSFILSEGSAAKGLPPSFADKERPLWAGWASGIPGDFDVRLDITAEEQVCAMEDALLTAITASSELSSPVEAALDVACDFRTPESHDTPLLPTQPVSFFPKTTVPSTFPGLNSVLPKEVGVGETTSSSLSTSSFPVTTTPSPHFNPLASFWTEIGFSEAPLIPQLRRRESQDSLGPGDNELEERHPLFWALVDMLVEVVGSSDHFLTRRGATVLISRLWAKPITEFLQSKLDSLVSEELLRIVFERIRACISPSEAATFSSTTDSTKTAESSCSAQYASKERLKTTLITLIPSMFEFVLGRETVRESVALFVESLQHPTLMRDFGLHLVDLLFVHLLLPV